jgi:hypothetical protein
VDSQYAHSSSDTFRSCPELRRRKTSAILIVGFTPNHALPPTLASFQSTYAMVSTGLLLSVAVVLLSTDGAAAFHPSAFSQRGLEESSASASGFGAGWDSSLLLVTSGYESTISLGAEADCTGTPFAVSIVQYGYCDASLLECGFISYDANGYPSSNVSTSIRCTTDLNSTVSQLFGDATYLRLDGFDDDDCTTWTSTTAVVADSKCHAQFWTTLDGRKLSYLTVANTNGSISWTSFLSSDCSGEIWNSTMFDQQQLNSTSCANKIRASTNAENSGKTQGSGNGGMRSASGASSQLVVASVAILAFVLPFVQ